MTPINASAMPTICGFSRFSPMKIVENSAADNGSITESMLPFEALTYFNA